jgi:hypothetical protein
MKQSTWVSEPDPCLVLHALAKSEKGNPKPFLWSSRSGPSTIYAFVILEIQIGSSFYVAPLTWGAGLLSTLSAHHLIDLCLLGRLSCCSSLQLLRRLKGLGYCPPHLLLRRLRGSSVAAPPCRLIDCLEVAPPLSCYSPCRFLYLLGGKVVAHLADSSLHWLGRWTVVHLAESSFRWLEGWAIARLANSSFRQIES